MRQPHLYSWTFC